MPVNLQHVKGYQDKNKNVNKLAYKAQLNIRCNKQAQKALEKLSTNLHPNPILPVAYPHLQVQNQIDKKWTDSTIQTMSLHWQNNSNQMDVLRCKEATTMTVEQMIEKHQMNLQKGAGGQKFH